MNKTVNIKSKSKPYRKKKAEREGRTDRKVTLLRFIEDLFAVSVVLFVPVNVYAANEAIAGLTNLSSLISSIIQIIGVIIAVISFSILGPGLSQHDSSQVRMGLMSLTGAVVMIFHMQILGVMGISI